MENNDDPYYDPYHQDYHGNNEQCPDCGNYENDCECGQEQCPECGSENQLKANGEIMCGPCGAISPTDQSDNVAAARSLSQTIQTPPDRGGNPSRRPLDYSNEDRQEMQRENVHEIMGDRDY